MDWSVLSKERKILSLEGMTREADNGRIVCKNMADFWGKLAIIERQYSDNLTSLLRSPAGTFLGGGGGGGGGGGFLNFGGKEKSLKDSKEMEVMWEQIKGLIKNRAVVHAEESAKISMEVAEVLRIYAEGTYPKEKGRIVECKKAYQVFFLIFF